MLTPQQEEDTWILRNYLYDTVKEKGLTPTRFTALGVDHHYVPFLNADYIDGGVIQD